MYMTSVALILMNYNVFNETGDFNDAGKTVARITPPGPNILRVLQNPARGPVEFILGGEDETGGVIDVFDIRGRRVDVVKVRGQTGTWDWRTAGVRPGVYFARLRSRGDETTTRFVVLH
jgi:hypothetical protein